jgi:hypothetical protein
MRFRNEARIFSQLRCVLEFLHFAPPAICR